MQMCDLNFLIQELIVNALKLAAAVMKTNIIANDRFAIGVYIFGVVSKIL